ncbi:MULTISPECIES: winged helix-turn-helix transcriptional regulator [Streptomyces]|uniref:Helix-turn-helix domain-containing protein n=1 Tax=Streptomyces flaveolus TaxID=67297 RepID=A0ABV3ARH7_9ACTN|nr:MULTISPECIES: helix-turn-helix domain-containing protein [Streptomyces]KOG71228.1 HxlR family transcriptional regulator [Streptomyces antibioticus]
MSDLLSERDTWSMTNCSIARTLEIVGNRTALLIMREAFFGTRRFDDFAKRVGIGDPSAAARLKELTAAGLLERVPYREPGQRTRYGYQLTEKGRDFLPVLVALRQWGDAWAADEQGPPVVVRHKDCGTEVRAALRCDEGHDVQFEESFVDAGPGLVRVSPDSP